jgi:hypothetical protein
MEMVSKISLQISKALLRAVGMIYPSENRSEAHISKTHQVKLRGLLIL